MSASSTDRSGHVIVCGLHTLGLRIVEQLYLSGAPVLVVDDDPDRQLLPVIEQWGVPYLAGSPRLPSVLVEAGVGGARAVVCVEEDDLRTLETALVARDLRADLRVVLQMTNAAVGRAVAAVTGAGTALDMAELAAPSLIQACLGQAGHDVLLGGERFEVVEVTAATAGTLRQLYGDLVPIGVVRGNTVEVCPGRDHPVQRANR